MMQPEPCLSFLEQALHHIALSDAAGDLQEARLHNHFARLFVQLEWQRRSEPPLTIVVTMPRPRT